MFSYSLTTSIRLTNMTLHCRVHLQLPLHGCISFALVTSHTVLALCRSPSQHWVLPTRYQWTVLHICRTVAKGINVPREATYYIRCPSEGKGFCLISSHSSGLRKSDPLGLLGLWIFHVSSSVVQHCPVHDLK